MSEIKADPERGFLCLDWKDNDPFELIGSFIDADHMRLEVILVPCNYVHSRLGYLGDTIKEGCVHDLES